MFKSHLLFIFLLVLFKANAQKQISGRVYDELSKRSLVGAKVYINNTSFGTVTDGNGEFKLTVPAHLDIELVVSYLKFEKKIYQVSVADQFEGKTIGLQPQRNHLKSVLVISKADKKKRKEWLQLFREIFIGSFDHGGNACLIKNPDDIKFAYDSVTKAFTASADVPIFIENLATKYLIAIELSSFKYIVDKKDVNFSYTARFTDLNAKKNANTLVRRNDYYYGSQMHFLRSLYKDSLNQEGFYAYKIKWRPNLEKARVTHLIRQKISYAFFQQIKVQGLEDLFELNDGLNYYKRVLKQADYLDGNLEEVDLRKFVVRSEDENLVQLKSTDTLLVYHIATPRQLKEKSSARYYAEALKQNEIVPHIGKSVVFVRGETPVYVNEKGKYVRGQLFVQGDMSRKVSGLIPDDFEPQEPVWQKSDH